MKRVILYVEAKVDDAQKELSKLEKQLRSMNSLQSGGGKSGGSPILTESQITGYRRLADQVSAVKDRLDQAKGAVSAFGDRISAAAASLKSVGIGLSAAITAPIVAFGYQSVRAAQESADALGQVEARLKSMGAVSGRTSEQLSKSATELMHLSTFDDDDILRNVTASMLTFGKVSGEQFDRAQLAAVNMSTALKTDLQSASLQVGKALNDPIKGITALSRAGVSFTQQQKDQIKTLVASGKTVEAQKMILKELESEFGGAAKAARDNNPWAVLKNAYDDFSESVGGILITAGKPVLDFIGNILEAVNSLSPQMKTAVVAVAAVLAAIGPAIVIISTLVEGIIAVGGAIISLIGILPELAVAGTVLAVVAASAYALYLAWQTNFGGIRDFTFEAWEAIKSATSAGIEAVSELTTEIGGEIVSWWRENYPLIQETVKTVSDFIKTNIQSALDSISEFWRAHGEQIMTVVKAAWSFISETIGETLAQIMFVVKAAMEAINGDWSGVWETIGESTGRGTKFIYDVIEGTGELILSAVKKIGDYIANNFDAAMVKTGEIVSKGLLNVLDAFVNLPVKIVEYAPKFYKAGLSVAESITKGLIKGLTGIGDAVDGSFNLDKLSQIYGDNSVGAAGGGQAKNALSNMSLADINQKFQAYYGGGKTAASGLDLVGSGAEKAAKKVKVFHQELGDLQPVLDAMRKGTMGQESNYGKNHNDNARTGAAGMFQVLPANVAAWTKEYYGKALSITEFKKNTDAQVAVFNGEMGKYLQTAMKKAGGDVKIAVRMAAAGWYGGEGAMKRYDDPTIFRKGEPSFREYTSKVLQKSMQASGGAKMPEIESFTEESKILQNIAEAYLRINALITTGGDANQKQLDVLQTYESNLKDIQKQVELINNSGLNGQLVVGLPDTPEDAARMVERLKALTDLQNSVKSSNDGAKEKLFELSQQMTDGLTDLEKFDYGLQQLRASGKLTADDFVLLSDGIDAYRQNLKKISELETAQKLAAEAKAVSGALSEMAESFKNSIGELGQGEDFKPFAGFIDQIKQIKELDLPTDAFAEFKTAISPNGIDTEKLASVARFWLEVSAAVGGTDPAQIDAIVGKLTQSATAFNQLNGAQKAAKNAEDYKGLTDNLDGEYQGLMRNGRELTAYEQTLKDLQTTYKDLSETEKENLLSKAAQIDAVKSAQESYDKLRGIVGESVDAFTNGGFKGLFESIKDRFKNFLKEMITEWLTSKIFGVFSGQGGGASNQAGAGGTVGGLFGNIFKSLGIGGGGSSSGGGLFSGAQGNGIFNLSGSSTGSNLPTGALINLANGTQAVNVNGNQGGGLSSLFSGQNISSAIASGGISAGLALFMSSLKTTSPIKGLLTGGVVGLIAGLFNRGKLRKQEEKQRTEFLNAANSGIGDFDKLIADVNALRINPPSDALTQGTTLGKTIHDQYVAASSALKDKKTRNIALNEVTGIDARIAEKMAALQAAVTKAGEAAEFKNKFVATFAGGAYMDSAFQSQYGDFKRRNGMMSGSWTGIDHIPALIANAEMVLNPSQQERIRRTAGFDVFAHADLPNYNAPKINPVRAAGGGAFDVQSPPIFTSPQPSSGDGQTINFNGNIILENVVALPNSKAYLETPDGQKQVINIIRRHTQDNPTSSDGLARDLRKADRR